MNFAIPFRRKFKYLDQDNVQFNINYSPDIKALNNFITEYGKKHRINLIMEDIDLEKDIPIIKLLCETFPTYKIVARLPLYDKSLDLKLVENGIPHFYEDAATNWDEFHSFLSLEVTDIIVAEELAFSAKFLKNFAIKKGVSLRCFCNVCQTAQIQNASIKSFFIRPEDIPFYEDYYDTCEFFVKKDVTAHTLNALYEAYSQEHKWFGKLKEIIIGYQGEEDNRFIIPKFGQMRLNCEKRCLKDESCQFCDRIISLSNTLKEHKIILQVDK